MNDWFEAEQHVERAHEFYEANRWDEAESELREALALNPFRAEWHFNLGLTLEAAGRRREAIQSFLEAHALDQSEPQTAMMIGVNFLRLENAAESELREAVRWLQLAAEGDTLAPEATVHLIEAHARLGEHDQAEVAFYTVLQFSEADEALAYVNIADSLTDRGLHDRAAGALREAVQLDPHMPGVHARLASAYAAMGRRDRARRLYLRELRNNPGDIDTLLDLGSLLMEMNRRVEAVEKFRRVLELESDNADAHYELAMAAMVEGRDEDAARSLRLVLKLDAAYPRARRRLAALRLHHGRPRDAQRLLCDELRTLHEQPASFDGEDREELARLLLDASLPAESALALAPLLEERADDPRLWRVMSVALFRSGRIRDGVRAARRERRLDPTSVEALHNIVLALIQEGRLTRAAVYLREAARRAPGDPFLRRLRMRLLLVRIARTVRVELTRGR